MSLGDSELDRVGTPSGRLVPSHSERAHKKEVERTVLATRQAGLRVDAEAALTGRIMERTVDLDNRRRSLADGDPLLTELLTELEVGFIQKARRIQMNFGVEL